MLADPFVWNSIWFIFIWLKYCCIARSHLLLSKIYSSTQIITLQRKVIVTCIIYYVYALSQTSTSARSMTVTYVPWMPSARTREVLSTACVRMDSVLRLNQRHASASILLIYVSQILHDFPAKTTSFQRRKGATNFNNCRCWCHFNAHDFFNERNEHHFTSGIVTAAPDSVVDDMRKTTVNLPNRNFS